MNRDVCRHGAPFSQGCERCGRKSGATQEDLLSDAYERGRKSHGWWPAEQDPDTDGLYVVRDHLGNTEVAVWLCDNNGKNGTWSQELRDVDRDKIIAWLLLPDYPQVKRSFGEYLLRP
jgi:hypothetical protein